VVVWDVDDTFSDSFLLSALELARMMCLCNQKRLDTESEDFSSIEKAILRVEKSAANLAKISTYARTVQNAGGKILKRAEIDRKSLEKNVKLLQSKLQNLRSVSEISG
jgi:hypothetical protein